MKFTCPRLALNIAVDRLRAAVPGRTPKEALACIKLTVPEGDLAGPPDRLTLTAFDLEVGIRYEMRGVAGAVAGSCLVPFERFQAILKECDGAEVALDSGAGPDTIRVVVGSSRFNLPSWPVEEFPDLPDSSSGGGLKYEVPAGILADLIKRTTFAAAQRDTGGRFALKGVLWGGGDDNPDTLRLVATDTKRLAIADGAAKSMTAPGEGGVKITPLVPPKAMKVLQSALTDHGDLVTVHLRANDALMRTEKATIYTTLVQGRYPPYRDILTQSLKGANVEVFLPVPGFLAAVRQAAVMTDEEACRVDMVFETGRVRMSAVGAQCGSSDIELALPDFTLTGKAQEDGGVKVAFDPEFLIEFLKVAQSEAHPTVRLKMRSGTEPVVFSVGEAETYQYLVMPLAG